ncbi:MAG: PQQ-binding-like beta-propeller repeat protein [Sedimentisphaerales bacterium]|nr:PQQ-binding-like beta-propeller repeat protein [Sedimentisphaerales bacterium]
MRNILVNPIISWRFIRDSLYFLFAGIMLSAGLVWADDWPTYMHDNHRSGVTAESLVLDTLNQQWVYTAPAPPLIAWDGGQPWDSDSFNGNTQVPMRNFDTAFFVTTVGDFIYFGSSVTDSVHCLSAATGIQQWVFTTDGPVRFPPSYYNGMLYFGSDDGYAYCIDAATGDLGWKYSPSSDRRRVGNNGKLINMWPIRTGTAVLDDKVYFAAALLPWNSSYLCSVNAATGSASGTGLYSVSGGNTPMSAILASSTKIYLAQGRQLPNFYDRSTGAYQGQVGSTGSWGGCFVLLTSDTGYAYSHGSGYKQKGYSTDAYVDYAATYDQAKFMIVSGTTAYVITEDFSINMTTKDKTVSSAAIKAINRTDQSTIWSVPGDSPYYYLILAGDTLFAGGTNKVTAHNPATGAELWSRSVQGHVRGLAAANGRLFVSTDTGKIYMFGVVFPEDFNHNGIVDLPDLMLMLDTYLDCTNPNDEDCREYIP